MAPRPPATGGSTAPLSASAGTAQSLAAAEHSTQSGGQHRNLISDIVTARQMEPPLSGSRPGRSVAFSHITRYRPGSARVWRPEQAGAVPGGSPAPRRARTLSFCSVGPQEPGRRRRRRPRPAPLSLQPDSLTDESAPSSQSSLQSSSLSPMSSMSPTTPHQHSVHFHYSPPPRPQHSHQQAPRSPGLVRGHNFPPPHQPSPQHCSPPSVPRSPQHSPRSPHCRSPQHSSPQCRSPQAGPRSPRSGPHNWSPHRSPQPSPAAAPLPSSPSSYYRSGSPSPISTPRSPRSPRSPQSAHLAFLASRRRSNKVERRTSNFLELPGATPFSNNQVCLERF